MKSKRELILAIEINAMLVVWIVVLLQFNYFYADSIEFDDTDLLLNIKPELKEGITFVYTNKQFQQNVMFPEKNNLGLYVPVLSIIRMDINEEDLKWSQITREQLLCHELCHHRWFKFMTKEEKQVWEDKFEDIPDNRKQIYGDANELHSEWCENNLGECYI